MVGLQVLVLAIGVRIPVRERKQKRSFSKLFFVSGVLS